MSELYTTATEQLKLTKESLERGKCEAQSNKQESKQTKAADERR
jgi:hypothetical protein